MIVDDAARCVAANPLACDLLGCPPNEIFGTPVTQWVSSEMDGDACWQTCLCSGYWVDEVLWQTSDGNEKRVSVMAIAHLLPGYHLLLWRTSAPPTPPTNPGTDATS